jgi:hypothetical protein
MTAKECIRMNDVKGLLPKPGTVGEQNEPETVTIWNLRSLNQAIEDDQLLTQHRIFDNKISVATGQVRKGSGEW